ncbi:MAG: hypothetical protein H6677_20700 [Candidatus Obscuribacterales bacterium]|nr:hypothetical protein [Candidatus Obscuribacterales bacterium]
MEEEAEAAALPQVLPQIRLEPPLARAAKQSKKLLKVMKVMKVMKMPVVIIGSPQEAVVVVAETEALPVFAQVQNRKQERVLVLVRALAQVLVPPRDFSYGSAVRPCP